MANYAIVASPTNTQSNTLPSLTLIGSSNKRLKVYLFFISSEAPPNDQSVLYAWQRCSTAGTPGGSFTPVLLDLADGAAFATCGVATFSVGPTLTNNAFVWRGGVNLRSGYHFQAAPGREIVVPATANAGIAAMPLVVNGGAYTSDFTVHFEE